MSILRKALTSAAIATNSFCNEKRLSTQTSFVQGRGVKLNELHVFNTALGTIHHGHAIAGSNGRVGSAAVHRTISARSQQRYIALNGFYSVCFQIEYIHTIAGNVWRTFGNEVTKMVLCN